MGGVGRDGVRWCRVGWGCTVWRVERWLNTCMEKAGMHTCYVLLVMGYAISQRLSAITGGCEPYGVADPVTLWPPPLPDKSK